VQVENAVKASGISASGKTGDGWERGEQVCSVSSLSKKMNCVAEKRWFASVGLPQLRKSTTPRRHQVRRKEGQECTIQSMRIVIIEAARPGSYFSARKSHTPLVDSPLLAGLSNPCSRPCTRPLKPGGACVQVLCMRACAPIPHCSSFTPAGPARSRSGRLVVGGRCAISSASAAPQQAEGPAAPATPATIAGRTS